MTRAYKVKKMLVLVVVILLAIVSTACVNQHPDGKKGHVESLNEIPKIQNPRVVATSMAAVEIMDKLGVDLIGVPDSKISKLPKRYEGVTKVGMAMSPDMEIVKGLNPDWVFSPVSLVSDLQPKYKNSGLRYGFLNLNNVPGMYKSISDLGVVLDKQSEAEKLVKEYEDFMKNYRDRHKGKKKFRVLVLMGLPGSYVVATNQSYVGSLVELSGAENVFRSDTDQFINISTEDMLKKNPDLILRTAHAMPEDVMKMFADEFKTNDIWSHFEAVKKDRVYDLDYNKFGMSAKFSYPDALEDLDKIFYGGDK